MSPKTAQTRQEGTRHSDVGAWLGGYEFQRDNQQRGISRARLGIEREWQTGGLGPGEENAAVIGLLGTRSGQQPLVNLHAALLSVGQDHVGKVLSGWEEILGARR